MLPGGRGRHLIVIVCSKCGTHNEATAEFCGGCGSFLEYTGTKVDDSAPAGPAAPPVGPSAAAPPVEPPAVSPAASVPEPPAVRPGVPLPSAGIGLPDDGQPLERRPTDQVPRTIRPAPVTPPPIGAARPGDIICANCHTPNEPSRHFCRACGKPLAAAAPAPGVPWWRRLFARKPAAPPAAGTRTDEQRETRRGTGSLGRALRNFVALLFVVITTFGLAGYVAVPSVRSLIDDGVRTVLRNFEQPVRVFPTGASGDQIAGHPPELAQDNSHNLYWAGPTSGSLPTITYTFQKPTDIVEVIVTPGAEDNLTDFARPKELRFTFSDGTVLTTALVEASLIDAPSGGDKVLANQRFPTNAHNVTKVTVEVRSLYPGTRPAVAIAELQFFGKP